MGFKLGRGTELMKRGIFSFQRMQLEQWELVEYRASSQGDLQRGS